MTKSASSTVKRTLDLKAPPKISAEQRARLEALAKMPDDQIDYSDAPYLSDAVWVKAAGHLPEKKKQITLRIDEDVIAFFKDSGKRYQSRINAVLRAYVESLKKAHG
jgi:uncharacterized protein (DUF4415 family)